MSKSEKLATRSITPDPSILKFFKGQVVLIGNAPTGEATTWMVLLERWAHMRAIHGEDVSRHFAFILLAPNRMCFGFEDPGEVRKMMDKHGESAERAVARLAAQNPDEL